MGCAGFGSDFSAKSRYYIKHIGNINSDGDSIPIDEIILQGKIQL